MGQRKCNPSPKSSVSQWEKQFGEALGWSMLRHPPTEANLKSNRYWRAVKEGTLSQHGISFSFLFDKIEENAPRKYSERNNKNCRETCFDRGGSGRLLCSFINNPTLTHRNVSYVISVSCGNSQDNTIYQLQLHLQNASTDAAWFYFPLRSYLQPVLGIFHHVK